MSCYIAAKPGYVVLTDDRDRLPRGRWRIVALDLTPPDIAWLAVALSVARLKVHVDMDTDMIA
jgi:hypothetical protein